MFGKQNAAILKQGQMQMTLQLTNSHHMRHTVWSPSCFDLDLMSQRQSLEEMTKTEKCIYLHLFTYR